MSAKLFLMVIIVITLIVMLILNAFVSTGYELAMVGGACALAWVHVLAGFFMSRWAMDRPAKQFMAIIMGGIGLRLLVVAIVLVILVPWIRDALQLFIMTFAVYYILFQIVEIFFIHRGLQAKRMNPTAV